MERTIWMIENLIQKSLLDTHSIQHDNVVCAFYKLQLVSDKNPRLSVEIFGDAFLVEMFGDMGVYRAQRIVEQIKIRLPVDRPREIYPRSLTSGERHTSFTDYCHIALGKLLKVLYQCAHVCHLKPPIFRNTEY